MANWCCGCSICSRSFSLIEVAVEFFRRSVEVSLRMGDSCCPEPGPDEAMSAMKLALLSAIFFPTKQLSRLNIAE